MGADCSQRQCLSGPAWITTSRGDVNYDGDVLDSATHHDDHKFTATSVDYLVDQFSPRGTWESWPSTFTKGSREPGTCEPVTGSDDDGCRAVVDLSTPTVCEAILRSTGGTPLHPYACRYTPGTYVRDGPPVDEGHFYMECSNRGHCDRKTGQCDCFPGYSGEACRRTECPEDCSGHGRCQTVAQQAGSFTYTLWDADMSRSCVCDPGWTGHGCETKFCPNDCSLRGKCINGTCKCENGWKGADCSERNCPNDCSQHGRCFNGTCRCFVGYRGADCASKDCPNACSYHGFCSDGSCQCYPGYTGEDCR